MVCKKCGHALGSKEAICPNCGALMSREQLDIRKEMNKGKNPYLERIYNIKQKNKEYNNDDPTNTNNTAYAIFIVICILVLAIIIAAILLR